MGDVDAFAGAVFGGAAAGGAEFGAGVVPFGKFGVGEEAGAEGGGVDDADVFGFKVGNEVGEGGVVEGVVAVGEHAIEGSAVEDVFENFQREAGDADEADFSLLLDFAEGGEGFFDDLGHVYEFDVVALHDVDVIEAHALEGFVDAAGDAFGGEIETGNIVATAFGADDVTVARDFLEGFTEDFFGKGAAVVGGGVDEIDAVVERDVEGADSFGFVGLAKLVAEGGGAVAED